MMDHRRNLGRRKNSRIEATSERISRMIELPKRFSTVVMGKKNCHTKQIARSVGGNCHIQLETNSPSELDAKQGAEEGCSEWIVMTADTESALDKAEAAVIQRMSELFIDDAADTDNRKAGAGKSDSGSSSSQALSTSTSSRISSQHHDQTENQTEDSYLSLIRPAGEVPGTAATGPQTRRKVTQPSHPSSSSGAVGCEMRFIAVDNSNVCGAARRLNLSAMAKLLSNGQHIDKRNTCVAGTNHAHIMSRWEDLGFQIRLGAGAGEERLVDDCLHAFCYQSIARSEQIGPSTIKLLVLATGDGNRNGGFTNFIEVVEHALQKGLHVEVWAWKCSCSSNFLVFLNQENFRLKYFDDYSGVIHCDQRNRNQRPSLARRTAIATKRTVSHGIMNSKRTKGTRKSTTAVKATKARKIQLATKPPARKKRGGGSATWRRPREEVIDLVSDSEDDKKANNDVVVIDDCDCTVTAGTAQQSGVICIDCTDEDSLRIPNKTSRSSPEIILLDDESDEGSDYVYVSNSEEDD